MTKLTSANDQQRRTLLIVLILNALLFLGLGAGGILADSSALLANAVDNASDSVVYLISFVAIGRAASWKRGAARLSGILLLVFAAGVLVDVGRRWWFGTEPVGWTMMGLALVAAIVNLVCLVLLRRDTSGDEDAAIGREIVETEGLRRFHVDVAGALVMWLDQSWPDLVVGMLVAAIAVKGGIEILRSASGDAT